ncbi:MAG: pyridoxine 5'-phosphate synthase [Candidatus Zixiibacteriota bacterium]|nr:MAG: pyridoxine 5'-phosphate synthase [candidate division Zixibacteria bacterium]
MALLSVNLTQIGAIRELRHLKEPDPAQAAVLAELGGADSITVQVRRDRRFIRDRDLYLLREVVKTRLTVEMPPVDELVERVTDVKPQMVTLLADQADSDAPVAPIDFSAAAIDFSDLVARLGGVGIACAFLIEPHDEAVKAAAKAGAAAVMLDCTGFTSARTLDDAQQELDRLDRAAQAAAKAGLDVHAGRGLGYKNTIPLTELGLIDEFVVGQAVIARAVLVGMREAVNQMQLITRQHVSLPA